MYNLKKTFLNNEVKYEHTRYSKSNKYNFQQIRCYILSNKFILIATICLFFYYLFMDINLYSKATRRHLFEVLATATSLNTERHGFLKQITSFNVFYPLTVKKIMMCDTTHYIRSPSAELVEDLFGFSDIFPFISANVISLTHCLLSLFAIRFLSHKTLFYRQLGVCIFQFRNFLDSFDGVIYRAHSKHKHAYKSVYGSHGYFIDAVSDVFGGVCLIVAIGLYLLKHPPPKRSRTNCFDMTPLNYQHEQSTTSRLSSKIAIVLSVVMIGIRLALSGLFWDRSVHAYEDLLDSKPFNIVHEQLQISTLNSSSTLFIMFAWRLMNALSLQDYILFAIFIDKIWEFIAKTQYIGWMLLVILIVLTELHLSQIRVSLFEAGSIKSKVHDISASAS